MVASGFKLFFWWYLAVVVFEKMEKIFAPNLWFGLVWFGLVKSY